MISLSAKDRFKLLIQEFHDQDPPKVKPRDINLPVKPRKVVTLYGPRRSGKTYAFYNLMHNLRSVGIPRNRMLYINFEDDRLLPLGLEDVGALLDAYDELYPENRKKELFLFLDELQNVDGWERFVRRVHDTRKAYIFITGSSSKLLSREIATSLRGRTISFPMYPLNFREFLQFRSIDIPKNLGTSPKRFKIVKELQKFMEEGGYPEPSLEEDDVMRKKILEEYADSLLHRDLEDRFSLRNRELLRFLLKDLATNITSPFSVSGFTKSVKPSLSVSRESVAHYLSCIQETGVFMTLPIFSWKLKEQRVNPRKIICLDNGIRNSLTFRLADDEGRLAENLVGSLLFRRTEELFYWKGKGEVDFVYREGRDSVAVNVTFGASVPDREYKSLLEFYSEFPKTKRLILLTRDEEGKHGHVEMIPLWKWAISGS